MSVDGTFEQQQQPHQPQPDNHGEKLKTVPRAFLFDVDGVLTDPAAKKITKESLPMAIADRINRGEIVSLNTGRSLSWLIEHDVIGSIERAVEDKGKLSDFIAIGEKGGTWLTWEDGEWKTNIDESIRVPESLAVGARNLIESEFSDSMFYDASKLTMISTEMIDGYSVPEFSKRQLELIPRLREIIAEPDYKTLDLQVDPTTIATDIQNRQVGKHLGARRIADWLKDKGIKPEHFITVGDSQSDTEMAEELQDDYSCEFVFVGDPAKLNKDKLHCPVLITDKKYEEGTLEFLESQK